MPQRHIFPVLLCMACGTQIRPALSQSQPRVAVFIQDRQALAKFVDLKILESTLYARIKKTFSAALLDDAQTRRMLGDFTFTEESWLNPDSVLQKLWARHATHVLMVLPRTVFKNSINGEVILFSHLPEGARVSGKVESLPFSGGAYDDLDAAILTAADTLLHGSTLPKATYVLGVPLKTWLAGAWGAYTIWLIAKLSDSGAPRDEALPDP